MRREALIAAIEAELKRQREELRTGVFDGDVAALADALVPVLLAEPSARARDIAESGTATMLDAAYVARDLLPLLRAIKPSEAETVLDMLGAIPKPETVEQIVMRMMKKHGLI